MSTHSKDAQNLSLVTAIGRFHQYEKNLAAGAQPNPEQLEALHDEGFEVVFNISPASTRNALPGEAGLVEGLGMDYVHFPVDCSDLRPLHYLTFRGILDGLGGKKVFVHCGGNIKSSNLIHMYNVLEKGVPEEESLAILMSIQDPEPKWFDYFKQMGMRGLSALAA